MYIVKYSVFYKRVVLISELSTLLTLITFKATQRNNVIRYNKAINVVD